MNDPFLDISDGLSGILDENEMTDTVKRCVFDEKDIEKATNILVDHANDAGGDDNITVILVQIE